MSTVTHRIVVATLDVRVRYTLKMGGSDVRRSAFCLGFTTVVTAIPRNLGQRVIADRRPDFARLIRSTLTQNAQLQADESYRKFSACTPLGFIACLESSSACYSAF
jgi:hypothetical protein